jgi:hypothetical protein
MKAALLAATVLMGGVGAGCAQTGFATTTDLMVPARPPGCHLDVVFQQPPPYRYAVLGLVATNSTAPALFAFGENDIAVMRRMMDEACTAGAHGLMNVAVSQEMVRVGRGYWKSTKGGAMAFVYVDAAGRPLPPPPDAPAKSGAAPPPPPAPARSPSSRSAS